MVVTSHEYLPFGEDWITEGDTKNAPKYNSQELDKESGYYFYNARHYDPEIARFVTPDTVIDGELSTQGWNRYAYVHNNPIRYKDPTGHASVGSELLAGAKESLSGYAKTAESIKSAVTNPSSVIDKVKNSFNSTTPAGFAKNVAKAYGSSLAESFKQITGMHYVDKIANIVKSDRPIKEIGKQGTDFAVDTALNYGAAKLVQGAGKLFNKAENLFSNIAGSHSLKDINPGYPISGRTQNCVNCAIATDATLSGHPASALPSNGPKPLSVLEKQYGGQFAKTSGIDEIQSSLLSNGENARGIIFGDRGAGRTGHVFNAVNQNGEVKFLDGQTGKNAVLEGYRGFRLLPTN